MSSDTTRREGSLDAPTRHALGWQEPGFYDESQLFEELERVFDICHGCRRCFNLCNSFPTLFDAVDESATMEVDGVPKPVYWEIVDNCFLCDMCYMTKCPYVPPHEWNVDFPHLMLRAKANKFKQHGAGKRDRVLANTDLVGKLAGIPVVAQTVNAVNRSATGRKLLEKTMGIAVDAPLPQYSSKPFRKLAPQILDDSIAVSAVNGTRGKVVLFATCYGNRNQPDLGEDLVRIYQHNGIAVQLADKEVCCGMPKFELGDLESVAKNKDINVPILAKLVDQGFDIVAPIPSCVLMFKQELPLMFPDDPLVKKVQEAMYDPFEYLLLRHKEGQLNTDFKKSLGKVAYHAACHLRVQNIGLKTRDLLALVPDTTVEVIERCSGHDGTYGVKKRFREASVKICRPVANKVKKAEANYYSSDCPMAGEQIGSVLADNSAPAHPLKLLRIAYGI